nr:histidine kinase [Spirosomataceae bacterium]
GMILYAVIVVAIFYALGNLNYMLKSALFEQFKYKYFSPSTLMLLISVFAISIGYRFFMDYNNAQINQRELESERMKSELSFLRSQISPHFMFNLVEPVLIKMSELLRYMLYESDDSLVTLDKELKYLESYIDLQKLRFGGYVLINFESYNVTSSKTIEPMLLIPFIENSFKHGVSLVKSPTINILMQIEENRLIFEVENKFNGDFVETKDGNSGIGLQNVRRRLELLYPNNHELLISQENGIYSVRLELTLKTSFKQNPGNIQSRVLESAVYQ